MNDETTHPIREALTAAVPVLGAALLVGAAFAEPALAARGGNGKKSQDPAPIEEAAPIDDPVLIADPSDPVDDEPTLTPDMPFGSMYSVVDQINARIVWRKGFTGSSVNVAVIDTGVAPVPALSESDKVVAMVDLSTEAGIPEAEFLDTFGHGTHMAGIIAGRDPGADPATAHLDPEAFLGVAPDAGLVSVKVGDNTGAVDVSQVIAGIEWVVEHAAELNIRVLNLSYGTDSTQPYLVDPLAYAVEEAWHAGIVVVVSTGNDGRGERRLANPASNPYVIAAGAVAFDHQAWWVPKWSTSGDGVRNPDVVAPGASIESLRSPGSRVDVEHPEGYVSETLFKGSGSSQAAAVVSGAVALILDVRPELTPDQVKHLLRSTATTNGKQVDFQGEGLIDVYAAAGAPTPGAQAVQAHPRADGSGSLDDARGTYRVALGEMVVEGEITVLGTPWEGAAWRGARWTTGAWDGARWTGASWRGDSWSGARWTGASWAGAAWRGARWTSAAWDGASWRGASWTGASWTGASWRDASWTGASWRADAWDGASWRGDSWVGAAWRGAGWGEVNQDEQ